MRSLRFKFSAAFLLLSSTVLLSQPGPPTSGPACWPPPCVPIDSGVSFLIVAGAAYGAKMIYDSRKKAKKLS